MCVPRFLLVVRERGEGLLKVAGGAGQLESAHRTILVSVTVPSSTPLVEELAVSFKGS